MLRINERDQTDLADRTAPGKLLHMSPHSLPADPALLAQRHRTSSVRSQSAAGI